MLNRAGLTFALLSFVCVLPAGAQKLVTDITIPGSTNSVAVDPNTNRIYVGFSGTSGPAVGVIDGSTNALVDTILTPQGSQFVAVNITTGRVYAAGCVYGSSSSCGVTVINGTTGAILATIPLAGSPNGIGVQGIAVNPVTNQIFVSDDLNFEIEIINGYTNTASHLETDNAFMLGLAVDFAHNLLLGTPSGGVLDIFGNHVRTQVPVGAINQDVAANPLTSLAYVTNNAANTLGVVNLKTAKVVTNITVGSAPYGVCVDYLSNLVFVANSGDNTIAEVNGKTNMVDGTVYAPSNYVDVNPASRLVYATQLSGSVVHVISE